VNSRRKDVQGRSRYYYKITSLGRKRLGDLFAEWRRVADSIQLVMGGQYA
jgi:DNA-binding PadR family transcriptional regulator